MAWRRGEHGGWIVHEAVTDDRRRDSLTVRRLEHHEALYALAPIRHLDLVDAGPVVEALFACEALSRLVSLSLCGAPVGDAGARAAAQSPRLGRLSHLYLFEMGIGRDGLEALAASERLGALEYLGFAGNAVPDVNPYFVYDAWGGKSDCDPSELARRIAAEHGPRPWLDQRRLYELGESPSRLLL